MYLHVVLRTCTHSSVHFKERFIPVSKGELVIHCLKSLVVSLSQLSQKDHRIRLSIIDDHSEDEWRWQMQTVVSDLGFETEFLKLDQTGNNASMKATYIHAANSDAEVIYILEDDYLHCREALPEMVHEYRHFQEKLRKIRPEAEVAIMPVDNRFHYIDEAIFASPVVMGTHRHWRVNYYANMTMMLSRKALRAKWDTWWAFSDYQLAKPETHEDALLTPVFRQAITLFTPLPTLAFHVAGHNYQSPYVSWEKIWFEVAKDYESLRAKAKIPPSSRQKTNLHQDQNRLGEENLHEDAHLPRL